MVLGLNRSRLRSDASGLFAVRPSPINLVQSGDWETERGVVLFESNADLTGGFPGYVERGCLLESIRFTVTENFLLIDERQPIGFGLPLRWIEGTALVQHSGKSDKVLRIFYRASGTPRCFSVRFGASRLGSRGVSRSMRVQHVLHSTGLVDRFSTEPPAEPNFTLAWDQTREFESENAIWTGRATAPVQVGSENIPSDVWLTTKSLIWGGGAGNGLNRIPLTLLMDMVSTRLKDRAGTPAIYISIGDARTGRFEIPFVFDLHAPPDRNFRERGAFLVGLRSRGLPEGRSTPALQPWRSDAGPRTLLVADDETLPGEPDSSLEPDESVEASPELPADDRGFVHAALRRIIKTGSPQASNPDIVEPEILLSATEAAVQTDDAGALLWSTVESLAVEMVESDDTLASDSSLGESWFVDIERPIVPLSEGLIDAQQTLHAVTHLTPAIDATSSSAIVDSALTVTEFEKDSTERFQVLISEPYDIEEPLKPVGDIVVAESSSGDTANAEGAQSDIPLALDWAEPVGTVSDDDDPVIEERVTGVDLLVSSTSEAPEDKEIKPAERAMGEPWLVVRRYEESALSALAEALRVIDDRMDGKAEPRLSEGAPSSWDQAQAVAEIAELAAQGVISKEKATIRRERLLSLGDVSVRLRTLVELFDTGHLTNEELDAKRSKLVKLLSRALIP